MRSLKREGETWIAAGRGLRKRSSIVGKPATDELHLQLFDRLFIIIAWSTTNSKIFEAESYGLRILAVGTS